MPHLNQILTAQYEASLHMLDDCLRKCPPDHWDDPIAKYPFWHVAYHTLCFVDYYLSLTHEAFRLDRNIHPQGQAELDDEYPSRRFTQPELLDYLQTCLAKARATVPSESTETLETPCSFPRRTFSRAELHIYNIRHIQHHTGQLSAVLRRAGVDTDWFGSGWR